MSRIGKLPVSIPDGVEVTVDGCTVKVKGPKGELAQTIPSEIKVTIENGAASCSVVRKSKDCGAKWGLSRVLINNMVTGVTNGFSKTLEIVGVGYRAEMKGSDLMLAAGYSHPVLVRPPQGVSFKVEGPNKVTVSGINKEMVGEMAATIRGVRPPEPYKGKGIRYAGEEIARKAGKTAGK